MAVTKLWPVTTRLDHVINYATNPEKTAAGTYTEAQYQALADVLSYAKDEEKTEREFFVEGINCNPTTARDQFVTVKEQYGKTDGIQAYHGYLSFKEQNITPELAQKIGMEFANEVWGKDFQVVVTTHLNTKHLHCHFVINSISFRDGHRCHDETSWFKFRQVADRICEKYGLYYNPKPNRSKVSSYYYNMEKAGAPTPHNNLREVIDYAISCSRSLADFDHILTKLGYKHCLSESHKYWTIRPIGKQKSIRLRTLGEDYTNDRIIQRIQLNARGIKVTPFQKASRPARQYRLPTRGHRIKKVGGLYGLYLYYCYRLGTLPRYKKQDPVQLHPLLREDLAKLNKISQETKLLARENISTDVELFSYKASVTKQITDLTAERELLRKKLRTKLPDSELSKVKAEIAEITDKLKTLRKEITLCDDIAERSKVMEQKLETIEAEEQHQNKGKEKNHHEQFR